MYSTDDAMSDHAARCTDAPYLSEFLAMDMDECWVNRSPRTMFETFHWFRGEGFDLILEDLTPGVIVEGFRLLPHLVAQLTKRAVWLLPTPEFREATFARRGFTYLRGTSDPEKGLRNLLERDRMFTEHLARETRRLDLPAIEVGTGLSESDLARQVAQVFELGEV